MWILIFLARRIKNNLHLKSSSEKVVSRLYYFKKGNENEKYYHEYRVSVGITVDVPVTAVSNKTNDIQCFKDI